MEKGRRWVKSEDSPVVIGVELDRVVVILEIVQLTRSRSQLMLLMSRRSTCDLTSVFR